MRILNKHKNVHQLPKHKTSTLWFELKILKIFLRLLVKYYLTWFFVADNLFLRSMVLIASALRSSSSLFNSSPSSSSEHSKISTFSLLERRISPTRFDNFEPRREPDSISPTRFDNFEPRRDFTPKRFFTGCGASGGGAWNK